MKKLVIIFAVTVCLVVASGISGLTFHIWPTSLGDHEIKFTPAMVAQLVTFKNERKFDPYKQTFYPGARNERERAQAQAAVDAIIDSLIMELPRSPKRSAVLRVFKSALSDFDTSESEERDQFVVYLQHIMAIVQVRDSGQLLNVWRYGFPYGWVFGA